MEDSRKNTASPARQLAANISRQVADESGDPVLLFALLLNLWRLHGDPVDPPFPWTDSRSRKTDGDLGTVWLNARSIAARHGAKPGAVIAEEWLAFMAWQANSLEPIHATPLAKFRAKFGQWQDKRDRDGLRNPPAYGLDEVAA